MFTIRHGERREIEGFQLFDDNNLGDEIIVAENSTGVVAYAQVEGVDIFFLESNVQGAGRALVEHLKERHSYLRARSIVPSAQGFWEKMGFMFLSSDGYGGEDWDWEE